MTIASDLLQRHFQTFVADSAQWQTLIADDLLWELAYARGIGHPERLPGREEVMGFVTWFLGAVENFRFFDLKVYPFADPDGAVAEVKAEGLIKPTGRIYRQEYVLFMRAAGGKIAFIREYYDPVRAAKALNTPIIGLDYDPSLSVGKATPAVSPRVSGQAPERGGARWPRRRARPG